MQLVVQVCMEEKVDITCRNLDFLHRNEQFSVFMFQSFTQFAFSIHLTPFAWDRSPAH